MLVKATEEPPTPSSTQGTSGSGMVPGQQPRAAIARSQSDLSSGAWRASDARKEEIEYFIPCVLPVRGLQVAPLYQIMYACVIETASI